MAITETRVNAENSVLSYDALKERLKRDNAVECRFHLYSFEENGCSEDPMKCCYSIEETVEWAIKNNPYEMWNTMDLCWLIVIFDKNGFREEIYC